MTIDECDYRCVSGADVVIIGGGNGGILNVGIAAPLLG